MVGGNVASTSLTGGANASLGGGGNAAGISSAFYGGGQGVASASETDGETFDGDGEFDEFEEWDFNEILSNLYVNFISHEHLQTQIIFLD